MSIRLRLTLLYSGLLGAALILFSLTVWGTMRWSSVQSADETLKRVADSVSQYYSLFGRLPSLNSLADRSTYVQLRTESRLIGQSGNLDEGFFPLPAAARAGTPVLTSESDAAGKPYRLYTLPITDATRVVFYVQVAYSLEFFNTVSERLLVPVLLVTLLVLGLGALGAWLVARRAVAPVEQVAHAALSVGKSADLSLRVPDPGTGDEVGTLVTTFNSMLDQLEGLYGRLAAAVDGQRRFAADASHELRTPLTIIRGNIEYLQKAQTLDPDALADMATEAERMTRLVEELLTVARGDAGQTPTLEPVALGPLVRESYRKAQALPHQVEFKADLPEALDRVMIMGNAEWLSRVLLILIDNAFKYTQEGEVQVRAGRQTDGVVIQVSDTGQGIAAADLPHVFDRFYRADLARGRGGAGLGLSIARWIAGIHGGQLTAESELGQGSRFSLWLPILRQTNS